jgi:hypothetical protein
MTSAAIVSQAVKCKFCGHWYINPCNAERRKQCRNVRIGPGEPLSHKVTTRRDGVSTSKKKATGTYPVPQPKAQKQKRGKPT